MIVPERNRRIRFQQAVSIPEDRNTSFLNRVVKPELADNSISSVDSGILKEYKARGNRKPRAKSAPPSCRSWEHLGGIMSKERLMIWEQHNRAIEEYGIASGVWPADFRSKAFPKEGKDFPQTWQSSKSTAEEDRSSLTPTVKGS